ncbi:MAG: 50S ribosomal protein L1 [Candidatus Korarchaeota archaeon]
MSITVSKYVDAVKSALQHKKRRFKESIELIVVLEGLDLKNPQHRIKMTVNVPHPTTEKLNVCVLGAEDLGVDAKKRGVDYVSREEMENISKNKKLVKKFADKYDVFITRSQLMSLVGKLLGSILAPRNKMPFIAPPELSLEQILDRLKKTVNIKVQKIPVAQMRVAKEDLPPEKIAENVETVINAMERQLDQIGAGKIKKIYIKKTMGAPVEVK